MDIVYDGNSVCCLQLQIGIGDPNYYVTALIFELA